MSERDVPLPVPAPAKRLVNPLTALRILALPPLWWAAWVGQDRWLAVGLALAVATDAFDGMLARRDPRFANPRFDTLADKLLTASALAWLALRRPQLLTRHPALIGVAAALALASLAVGFRRHGRVVALHTHLGRLGGFTQAVFACHALGSGGYSRPLFYLAIGLFVLATIEELLIQLAHGRLDDESVRSIAPVIGDRLRAWERRPPGTGGLVLAALLLTAPALGVGLQFDDHLLLGALRRAPDLPAGLDQAFVFLDGDSSRTLARMDRADLPWWTLPQARVAFWRPLSALTHALDLALWPGRPALMHLHSLIWFGLLVMAAAGFYRRFLPAQPATAMLAAALWALDDARGFAVGWLANRNALVAALLGILALGAHDRWRREGWQRGALLSPLLLGLGLLAGESAAGTLAYLAAYALFLDPRAAGSRLRSIAPAGVVFALWQVAYRVRGFGAWGTSYVDPATEPLRFARVALERAPILLLGQWALPPAELYSALGPELRPWLLSAAVALLAVLARLLWPLLRASPTARFLALGMLLATLPAASSLPANRLLFFVGLGAMGLLAEVLRGEGAGVLLRRVLAPIHCVLGPLLLPVMALSPWLYGRVGPPAQRALAACANPGAASTLILVNGPSVFHARIVADAAAPDRVRSLAPGLSALEVERADARTLLLRPEGGFLRGFDEVFRGASHPLAAGETVRLASLEVEVRERTSDLRPAAVAFRFDRALEDTSLCWGIWSGDDYRPFAPPPLGARVALPPPVRPTASP